MSSVNVRKNEKVRDRFLNQCPLYKIFQVGGIMEKEIDNKKLKGIDLQSAGANVPLAIVLGFIFGIIGAFIWFGFVVVTKWQFGLVAVIVGLLVGYGVLIGSGKKRSKKLQIM